jgi:hypothetical protein
LSRHRGGCSAGTSAAAAAVVRRTSLLRKASLLRLKVGRCCIVNVMVAFDIRKAHWTGCAALMSGQLLTCSHNMSVAQPYAVFVVPGH